MCVLLIGLFLPSCGGRSVENQSNAAQGAAQYEGKIIKHDGTSADDAKIYLVSGGQRHWIPSMDWFAAHGKSTGDVIHVTQDERDKIPEGDPAK